MKVIKPVQITKGSFNFCRTSIAVLVWLSFIFKSPLYLYISFIILLISALVKVEKAPMVLLYTYSVEKVLPSKKIFLDENGITFAHTVGAVLTAICILMVTIIHHNFVWIMVLLLAILKTTGAFGYCSALKLYSCITADDCCKVSKSILKRRS